MSEHSLSFDLDFLALRQAQGEEIHAQLILSPSKDEVLLGLTALEQKENIFGFYEGNQA